jgi:3-oxoacyl-(acyl-carrier-protein) synthase
VGFAYAACEQALAMAGVRRLDAASRSNAGSLLHLGTSLEIFDLEKVIYEGRPDFKAVAERSLLKGSPPLQIPLDTASGLIADHFGRPATRLTNCSACAAGAQAIGHGLCGVRSGQYDLAVCGGFDSMINPLGVGGFQLLGALSTDNARGPSTGTEAARCSGRARPSSCSNRSTRPAPKVSPSSPNCADTDRRSMRPA